MATCVLLGIFTQQAPAQSSYPNKPVRIIVGPGPDIVARMFGQKFTESWGHQTIVEQRPGGGGVIATEMVAKAPPDGYTLLLGNAGPITINPSLHKKMPYDAQRDLLPIAMLSGSPMVMVAHPSLPVKTVKEFVQFAKQRPGQINYCSSGVGNQIGRASCRERV